MSDEYCSSEADRLFRNIGHRDYHFREHTWPPRQDYSNPLLPQPPPVRRSPEWFAEYAKRHEHYVTVEQPAMWARWDREREAREYAEAPCEPPADAEALIPQVVEILRRFEQ